MSATAAQLQTIHSFEAEQAEKEDAQHRSEMEKWLAGKIGTAIQRAYPRLRWGVEADTLHQYILITCPILSANKGYYLHLHKYTVNDLEKRAIIAAGEILERHGVARHQCVNVDKVEEMPRDLRGSVIASDSAPEPLQKCQ